MEDVFWKLDNAKRCYLAGVYKDYTEIMALSKELVTQLDKCTSNEISCFKDSYYDDILSLQYFVKNHIRNDTAFRSLHDKIFDKYLQLDKTPTSVTIVFEDLIKGITYFSDQFDKHSQSAIYHRLLSCGPNRNQTFRETYLQCNAMQAKSFKK